MNELNVHSFFSLPENIIGYGTDTFALAIQPKIEKLIVGENRFVYNN